MPITKFKIINDASKEGRNASDHLKNAINYIINPNKTNNGEYVEYVNCTKTFAYDEMINTKKVFDKTNKRQGYHWVISCKEGEASPELMMQLTKEFCEEYFENKYEIVYSVHNDQKHIHSHIVFNSVSYVDGKKYWCPNQEWEKSVQPIVNKLSKRYGISEIEIDENKETIQNKKINYRLIIKNKIDEMIEVSVNYEDMLNKLREEGYKINQGKYLQIKTPGQQKYIRTYSIGNEYTIEKIIERIADKHKTSIKNVVSKKINIPTIKERKTKRINRYTKYKNMTPLMKRHIRSMLKRKSQLLNNKNRKYYRKECNDLKKYYEEYVLMCENKIESIKDIAQTLDIINNKIKDNQLKKKIINKKINSKNNEMSAYNKSNELFEAAKHYEDGDKKYENEYLEYKIASNELILSKCNVNNMKTYIAQTLEIKKELDLEYKKIKKEKRVIENLQRRIKVKEHNSLDELINGNVFKYIGESKCYIVDADQPGTYIEMKPFNYIYNSKERIGTEYILYKDNNELENKYNDKIFKNRPKYYFYNMKRSIKKDLGLSTNLVKMSQLEFINYTNKKR